MKSATYQAGYDAFMDKKDGKLVRQELHSSCPDSNTRSEFYEGLLAAESDYVRETLNIKGFLAELKLLCEKYHAEVETGCGCCGSGGYVTDEAGRVFEFEVKVGGGDK